jgi:hypothetical protein
MTTKAEWRERAKAAEARLPLADPMPKLDTLTVCFTDRTITFRGRTITTEANCIAFPVTSGTVLYTPHHDPVIQ